MWPFCCYLRTDVLSVHSNAKNSRPFNALHWGLYCPTAFCACAGCGRSSNLPIHSNLPTIHHSDYLYLPERISPTRQRVNQVHGSQCDSLPHKNTNGLLP